MEIGYLTRFGTQASQASSKKYAIKCLFDSTSSGGNVSGNESNQTADSIEIVASEAKRGNVYVTAIYLKIRNGGQYPIRITKLIEGAQSISQAWVGGVGMTGISNYFYLEPGQEGTFSHGIFGTPFLERREVEAALPIYGSYGNVLTGAQAQCVYGIPSQEATCINQWNSTYPQYNSLANCHYAGSWGSMEFSNFGIEYVEYGEGNQTMTKTQTIGALSVPCSSWS